MKKTLIKFCIFVAFFLVALKAFSVMLNRGNTDLTQDMAPASLPVIYMNVNDRLINALHGYTSEMEGAYMRDYITPINADRTLDVVIDTYGFAVAKVGYELRSTDGSRLIEDTELESFTFADNTISTTFAFKDLIDDDTEYMLVIKLITGEGYTVRYYARIINAAELYLDDKLKFASDFSNKTFAEETAVELKKYMETNSEGDNSSYGHVTIHSNFNQLHWGYLSPLLVSEKNINLISIDSANACIELTYRVQIKDETYNVREYFRLKKGSDRLYLMEYDRTANQIINDNNRVIVNGKIINGIVDEDIKVSESPDGSVAAFVQQDSLYSFTQTGQLTRIFSFRDDKNDDARTRYDAGDIKVLSIDESGNTYFIVYGYQSRGMHEGSTGIVLYYYDAVVNTIEEQLYIPYTKNWQILRMDMEQLSYFNSRSQLYLLVDGAVYSVNMSDKSVTIVADNLDENRFVSSASNKMIAWQTGESVIEYNSIMYYNLDKTTPKIIEAGRGNIIVPLGFIGEDLVYGTARSFDVTTDSAGRTIIPMYKVTIESILGEVLLTYSRENTYITGVDISEEMIVLHRMQRNEELEYIQVSDDEILNNSVETLTKNTLKTVVTDEMETTYQIVLAKEGSYDSVKVMNPKEVLFEEDRTVDLEYKDTKNRYYVYSQGMLKDICSEPSEAVIMAEELYGEVVNKRNAYVWESGNRKSKYRMETIGDTFSDNGSLLICLEQVLKYNEVYKDSDTLLTGGNTVLSVLRDNIDGDILDLTGCTLDSVLYYAGRGYPVLAVTDANNAVIITGFDAKNTIIYDPLDTEVRKKGLNDSRDYFEQNGNRFITYVK